MSSNNTKVGDKINYWEVLEVGINSIKCKCTCGHIRETWLCKIVGTHPLRSCGCMTKEIRKQKALAKYGVENVSQAKSIKDKKVKTTQEHFGVAYPMQSKEIMQKSIKTVQKKYGVNHISQAEHIKAQKVSSYVLQDPQVKEHSKNLFLEHYGVENPALMLHNRNRLRDWCADNPDLVTGQSLSELELKDWISQYYPSVKKTRLDGKEIDVHIPELNLGIEYDGLFWHSEEVAGKFAQRDKTKHFAEKNIRIIHVFEHEWLTRKDQVKSFILSLIGKNQHKLGARKCTIKWSNLKEDIALAHKFLDQYHIQSFVNSTQYVTLIYKDQELISVATFGHHHRGGSTWILSRFCTKTNFTIQGLLSKLTKLASSELKADIVSWADCRYSTGNGYKKAGWILEETLPPDYLYFKGIKTYSKQSRQKKKIGTLEGMTESEHAKLDGLRRIWDCGKLRFIYKYKS